MSSPYCSLYISCASYKENLFKNQELLELAIISSILMNLMFDSRVILWGEIRCLMLEISSLTCSFSFCSDSVLSGSPHIPNGISNARNRWKTIQVTARNTCWTFIFSLYILYSFHNCFWTFYIQSLSTLA